MCLDQPRCHLMFPPVCPRRDSRVPLWKLYGVFRRLKRHLVQNPPGRIDVRSIGFAACVRRGAAGTFFGSDDLAELVAAWSELRWATRNVMLALFQASR